MDLTCFLQGYCCFKQDSVFGPHSVSYHNGNRCGKSKGTGTADDQNRNTSGKCISELFSCQQPDNGGDNRNTDNCRNKNSGNPVCDFGNRCFCCSRITDHLNNLGKSSVLAYPGSFASDKSGLVYGCSRDCISRILVNRDTLPCKCRLIDSTVSLKDHSVHRNVLTGTYHKNITFSDLFDGHRSLLSVPDNNCCLRCQLHQTFQRIRCLSLRSGFQHFSNCDQGKDHGCRFKIELHHVIHNCCRISVHLCPYHCKKYINTPQKGCHGTKCYKGIHIWCTMPQTLKAADKKFLVNDHYDSGEKKLHQSHGNMIIIKPCRKRPAPHHMSHGKIHQHKQKAYRCDQPSFQCRCFMVFQCLLCRRSRYLFSGCPL